MAKKTRDLAVGERRVTCPEIEQRLRILFCCSVKGRKAVDSKADTRGIFHEPVEPILVAIEVNDYGRNAGVKLGWRHGSAAVKVNKD